MAASVVQLAAREVGLFVDPLRVVVVDPAAPHELVQLLRHAGWRLPGLSRVDLAPVTSSFQAAIEQVEALPAPLATGSLDDLVTSLAAIRDAIGEVQALADALGDLLDATVGNASSLASDLVDDVWQLLVLRWMARRRPLLTRVLKLLDVVTIVEPSPVVTDGGIEVRGAGRVLRMDPMRLLDLLGDPVEHLRTRWVPDGLGSSLDAQVLALALGAGLGPPLRRLGGQVGVATPWGSLPELPVDEQDVAGRSIALEVPLPSPDGVPWLPRLAAVAEVLSAGDVGQVAAGPGVELSTQGALDVQQVVGGFDVELDLGTLEGILHIGPDSLTTQAGIAVGAGLTITGLGDPLLVGGTNGSRLELGPPRLHVGLSGDGDLDVEVEVATVGSRLVVTFGDGDSFLAGVLPDVDVDTALDLGLAWSRTGGLRLVGGSDLAATIRVNESILGVLTLDLVTMSLDIDGALALAVVVDGTLDIGPFSATIEQVGLDLAITPTIDGSGNLGIVDLALAFHPPTGVTFEIAVGDTIRGGGFIRHDPATGRYTGVLTLEFLAVELGALAVVDTRLPDDPDGWALFASLYLTFPQVPLGFGFFLSGVGGIVALHRTMDSLAIAGGLRDGAVDMILFPDDPAENSEEIIAGLDQWFPLAQGSTVVGIAAVITWGTPETIITGQLGIMLALPDLEIAVLGSIELVLPTEDPLLELHLDTLGSYSASDRTLLVMASLYDSTLLGTIDLSGDMALYSRFGDQPYFLFSVGGYHPDFKPPGSLPSVVTDLRRMRAEVVVSEDVWYALEAYVAVTSNTFQFGAQASFEASTRFLGVTYTASGHIGFDVLLQFSPFRFVASFHAGVAVTSGDNGREIVAAELEATLNGPKPWAATGYGRFTFLGIKVRFEVAVGGASGVEVRARTNVLGVVVEALEALAGWTSRTQGGDPVVLVEDAATQDDQDGIPLPLRVRPDAVVEARQTVAPLNRAMDLYGLDDIDGPSRIDITGAGITGLGSSGWEAAVDWFAPAQYDDLGRSAKLSADSFEEMDAGVSIDAGGVAVGPDAVSLTPDWEVKVVSDMDEPARLVGTSRAIAGQRIANAGAAVDRTPASWSRTAALDEPFVHVAKAWTLADPVTGRAIGRTGTYNDRLGRMHSRPTGAAVLVPAHAASGMSGAAK